ncbi:MAG: hypothetical protein IJ720_03660 [Clostridia bacterium]|nr:hypothetical protein [Clostridia bacterium]
MQNRLNVQRTKLETLQNSNVLRSFDSLVNEKRIKIDDLTDRMARSVSEQTHREGMRLDRASIRLEHAMSDRLKTERSRFAKAAAQMQANDPVAVLARGYSIAETKDCAIVKRVEDVTTNDNIRVRVSDGTLHCTVDTVEPKTGDQNG